MSSETLELELVGLPPGRSVHQGRLEFRVLDAASQEEPLAVLVKSEVNNMGTRIHVRSTVTGQARSTCHRCLVDFQRQVETSLELTLQRGITGHDEVVAVSELAARFDLSPYVREAVVLEEPIRLLCKPSCRGLCAACGADLNQKPCGCVPPPDERWAALGDLVGPQEE